jgi:ClpP class serine protease
MQSRVDDYYGAFTKAWPSGRGVPIAQVRDGMGQGRVLGAEQALAEKMVDGIATFDDVLKKMQRDAKSARADAGGQPAQSHRAAANARDLSILG